MLAKKYIKLIIFLLVCSTFGFIYSQKSQAATCTVSTLWRDQNKQDFSGNNSPVGQTYYAVATYTNCIGYTPSLTLFGGSYDSVTFGTNSGTPQGLGSNIATSPEERNANFKFSTAGDYYYIAWAKSNTDTQRATSGHLQAVVGGTPPGNPVTPQAVIDNSSPTMGGNINITIKNPPSGNWSAKVFVNDYIDPSVVATAPTFPLAITQNNGFDNVGANSIEIIIYDSSGTNKVGDNKLSLNVSSAGGQVVPTACTGTGQGNCPTAGQTCVNNVCQNPQTGATPTLSANLYNPLPESDLTHAFLLITKGFLDIVGIWAVMFIIIGGFQMVLSSGNEEAILKAKKTITWAVLGLAVALLSFSIIAIVEDLLQTNIQPPATTTQTPTK